MKLEELWTKVSDLKSLPNTAICQIPSILSQQAKIELCKRTPEEAAKILKAAIYEIDHGSVERVNNLVLKMMKSTEG